MKSHEYGATIVWERDGERFVDNKYSRAHDWHFDGASVVASSSPLLVPVPYSSEKAVDPEEAFVASLSACHMLLFLSIVARKGFVIDYYKDSATGLMGKDDNGKTAILKVTLSPEHEWSGDKVPSDDDVSEMHHAAHEMCFIANSVKTKITMRFEKEASRGELAYA